eukprot:g3020.t1
MKNNLTDLQVRLANVVSADAADDSQLVDSPSTSASQSGIKRHASKLSMNLIRTLQREKQDELKVMNTLQGEEVPRLRMRSMTEADRDNAEDNWVEDQLRKNELDILEAIRKDEGEKKTFLKGFSYTRKRRTRMQIEWLKSVPDMNEREKLHLEDLFDAFDLSEDGVLGIEEFTSMMGVLHPTMSRPNVENHFAEVDADSDGFVSFEEFYGHYSKSVSDENFGPAASAFTMSVVPKSSGVKNLRAKLFAKFSQVSGYSSTSDNLFGFWIGEDAQGKTEIFDFRQDLDENSESKVGDSYKVYHSFKPKENADEALYGICKVKSSGGKVTGIDFTPSEYGESLGAIPMKGVKKRQCVYVASKDEMKSKETMKKDIMPQIPLIKWTMVGNKTTKWQCVTLDVQWTIMKMMQAHNAQRSADYRKIFRKINPPGKTGENFSSDTTVQERKELRRKDTVAKAQEMIKMKTELLSPKLAPANPAPVSSSSVNKGDSAVSEAVTLEQEIAREEELENERCKLAEELEEIVADAEEMYEAAEQAELVLEERYRQETDPEEKEKLRKEIEDADAVLEKEAEKLRRAELAERKVFQSMFPKPRNIPRHQPWMPRLFYAKATEDYDSRMQTLDEMPRPEAKKDLVLHRGMRVEIVDLCLECEGPKFWIGRIHGQNGSLIGYVPKQIMQPLKHRARLLLNINLEGVSKVDIMEDVETLEGERERQDSNGAEEAKGPAAPVVKTVPASLSLLLQDATMEQSLSASDSSYPFSRAKATVIEVVQEEEKGEVLIVTLDAYVYEGAFATSHSMRKSEPIKITTQTKDLTASLEDVLSVPEVEGFDEVPVDEGCCQS